MALDTEIRLGHRRQTWALFRGVWFRWFNRTKSLRAVLVVPQEDQFGYAAPFRLGLVFLSHFSHAEGFPVSVYMTHSCPTRWGCSGSGRRIRPLGIGLNGYIYLKDRKPSLEKDRALALFAEGLRSSRMSPIYAFLCYYKVIQLPFKKDGGKIKDWMTQALQDLNVSGRTEWQSEIAAQNLDPVDYLYKHGRNAIAHIDRLPLVDSDEPADVLRIRRDLEIVRALAARIIDTVL